MGLSGAGFQTGMTAALIAGNGTTYALNNIVVISSTQLSGTIPAGAVPGGTYTVEVTEPDGATAQLSNAFKMVQGGEALLTTKLLLPSALGFHTPTVFYVQYSNLGDASMPAPLLELHGAHGVFLTVGPRNNNNTPSDTVDFLAPGSGATPWVLQPGDTGRVAIYYYGAPQPWNFSRFTFDLSARQADDSTPIDWGALASYLRVPGFDDQQWNHIVNLLRLQIGDTWGGYVSALDTAGEQFDAAVGSLP
jgi:hypothetical protein